MQLLEEIYRRIDREQVLSPLEPKRRGEYLELRCPKCGKRRAYIYNDGTTIRCNRADKCGASISLFDWVRGSYGLTSNAMVVSQLARWAGVDERDYRRWGSGDWGSGGKGGKHWDGGKASGGSRDGDLRRKAFDGSAEDGDFSKSGDNLSSKGSGSGDDLRRSEELLSPSSSKGAGGGGSGHGNGSHRDGVRSNRDLRGDDGDWNSNAETVDKNSLSGSGSDGKHLSDDGLRGGDFGRKDLSGKTVDRNFSRSKGDGDGGKGGKHWDGGKASGGSRDGDLRGKAGDGGDFSKSGDDLTSKGVGGGSGENSLPPVGSGKGITSDDEKNSLSLEHSPGAKHHSPVGSEEGNSMRGNDRSTHLKILQHALEFFQAKLFAAEGVGALRYLRGRGYTEAEIKKMGLGFYPSREALRSHLTEFLYGVGGGSDGAGSGDWGSGDGSRGGDHSSSEGVTSKGSDGWGSGDDGRWKSSGGSRGWGKPSFSGSSSSGNAPEQSSFGGASSSGNAPQQSSLDGSPSDDSSSSNDGGQSSSSAHDPVGFSNDAPSHSNDPRHSDDVSDDEQNSDDQAPGDQYHSNDPRRSDSQPPGDQYHSDDVSDDQQHSDNQVPGDQYHSLNSSDEEHHSSGDHPPTNASHAFDAFPPLPRAIEKILFTKNFGVTHQVVLPFHDGRGHLQGFILRSLLGDDQLAMHGERKYKYNAGLRPGSVFFNLHRALSGRGAPSVGGGQSGGWSGREGLVVVEGYFDALIAWARGMGNVVAIGGALPTRKQVAGAVAAGVRRFVLALDNDRDWVRVDDRVRRSLRLIEQVGGRGYVADWSEFDGGGSEGAGNGDDLRRDGNSLSSKGRGSGGVGENSLPPANSSKGITSDDSKNSLSPGSGDDLNDDRENLQHSGGTHADKNSNEQPLDENYRLASGRTSARLKDPDELMRRFGVGAFALVVSRAVGAQRWVASSLLRKYGIASLGGGQLAEHSSGGGAVGGRPSTSDGASDREEAAERNLIDGEKSIEEGKHSSGGALGEQNSAQLKNSAQSKNSSDPTPTGRDITAPNITGHDQTAPNTIAPTPTAPNATARNENSSYVGGGTLTDLQRDALIAEALEYGQTIVDPIASADFFQTICGVVGCTLDDLKPHIKSYQQRLALQQQQRSYDRLLFEMGARVRAGRLAGLDKYVREEVQSIHAKSVSEVVAPYTQAMAMKDIAKRGDGLKTGFAYLDNYFLIPKEAITVVAGRPAHGKTTLMLNIFLNMIDLYPRKRFFFFSYEQSKSELYIRIINILAGHRFDQYKNLARVEAYLRKWGGSSEGDSIEGNDSFGVGGSTHQGDDLNPSTEGGGTGANFPYSNFPSANQGGTASNSAHDNAHDNSAGGRNENSSGGNHGSQAFNGAGRRGENSFGGNHGGSTHRGENFINPSSTDSPSNGDPFEQKDSFSRGGTTHQGHHHTNKGAPTHDPNNDNSWGEDEDSLTQMGGTIEAIENAKQKYNHLVKTGRLWLIEEPYHINELTQTLDYLAGSYDNVGGVFIDYIQKIKTKEKFQSRQVEIQKTSAELLEAAKRNHFPIVVGAQFNREVQDEQGVSMSSLRESGDIEQDASLILGLFNGAFTQAEAMGEEVPGGQIDLTLKIIKNRNGLVNKSAKLIWDLPISKIRDT